MVDLLGLHQKRITAGSETGEEAESRQAAAGGSESCGRNVVQVGPVN